jgi:predicted HAD superfamily hydrolase
VIGFFLIFEFIFCIFTIRKIIKTQTALFYLRNAPLVDKKFNMMFKAKDTPVRHSREVAVGVKKLKDKTAFGTK